MIPSRTLCSFVVSCIFPLAVVSCTFQADIAVIKQSDHIFTCSPSSVSACVRSFPDTTNCSKSGLRRFKPEGAFPVILNMVEKYGMVGCCVEYPLYIGIKGEFL